MFSALLAVSLLSGVQFVDDFTYPGQGAPPEPWKPESVAWEIRDGWLTESRRRMEQSFITLEGLSPSEHVSIEATIRVEENTSATWSGAGLVIRADRFNYWYLQLIGSPDSHENSRGANLFEMNQGCWGAQSRPGTRLEQSAYEGVHFDWQYGRPYRLRLELTSGRVEGMVMEMDGVKRAHFGYLLDGWAVDHGKPGLACGGFAAAFDDVHVSIGEAAGPAPRPEPAARGFYRVEERKGRWWLVDPSGELFYAVGVDGPNFYGVLPPNASATPPDGPAEAWARHMAGHLLDYGFNTLSNGQSPILNGRGLPHIDLLHIGRGFADLEPYSPDPYLRILPNVFHPQWEEHCRRWAASRCAPSKHDPSLMGYYLDNELPWFGSAQREWGLFEDAWRQGADSIVKQAWVEFLRAKLDTPGQFESLWGVRVRSFDDLPGHTGPAPPLTGRAREIARDWVRLVAERYFAVAATAIRDSDPNHLVMGCRFAQDAPGIWDIAGRYCDVVSVNLYPKIDVRNGVSKEFVERVNRFHKEARRPLLVSEWNFPSFVPDKTAGPRGGVVVESVEVRAGCYPLFQRAAFALPGVVGSIMFLCNEVPNSRLSYGLLDEGLAPYEAVASAAAPVNAAAASLHRQGRPTWRDPAPPVKRALRRPRARTTLPKTPLTLETGPLTLQWAEDGHAFSIRVDNGPSACLYPRLHVRRWEHLWMLATGAEVLAVRENRVLTVVDVAFVLDAIEDGAGERIEVPIEERSAQGLPTRFRVGYRFVVPRRADGWFSGQLMWVENNDPLHWSILGALHWLEPAGEAEFLPDALFDNTSRHRGGDAWVDPATQTGLACWYPHNVDDPDFVCYFVKVKGREHAAVADVRHQMDIVLRPDQRQALSLEPVFFFALEGASPDTFDAATQRMAASILE